MVQNCSEIVHGQSVWLACSQFNLLLLFDPRSGVDDEDRDRLLLSFFRSGVRDRDLEIRII